jgi:hypothetical protein
MSKDNAEKYDGEKNLGYDDAVAVLPPDEWVCSLSLEVVIESLPIRRLVERKT